MGIVVMLVLVLLLGFGIGWFARDSRRAAGAVAEQTGGSAEPEQTDLLASAYADGYAVGYQAASGTVGARLLTVSPEAPAEQAAPSPLLPAVSARPGTPGARKLPHQAGPPTTPRLAGPPPAALRRAAPNRPPVPLPSSAPLPYPVQTAASAAAEEARKQQRDLRNINITLYAACLLLVAAASLFIGLAIPESARFGGVTAVAVLFYAGGLAVHTRSRRLRPAGVAFAGTGLALIPVAGLALNNLVLRDAPLAWLGTSVVGTAAFAYAAAKLDSRVVAYLSMTFLLSTALASGAAMRSGIVWYFLFTVLLATAISLLAMHRPAWLRNIYLDAFVRSHRYLVPTTAGVALLTAPELGGWQFSFLFLSFAGYYAVVFLQSRRRERLFNSYGFRISVTAGLSVLTEKLTGDAGQAILLLALLLSLQVAGLLAWRRYYNAAGGRKFFGADLAVLLAVQALTGVASGFYGMDHTHGSIPVFTATAALVLLTFMAAETKLTTGPTAAPAAATLILGFLPRISSAGGGPLWPAVLLGGLLLAYLCVRAVRATGPCRPSFALAARAAATGLVPVLAVAFLEAGGAGAADVWIWSLMLTTSAVLLNQAVSVYREASGSATVFADATLGVAVALVALLTVWLRFVEGPRSSATLAVLVSALAVNILTSLFLRRFFADKAWLEWVAPAGFAAAAVVGAGILGVRGYEVLAGAGLAYCALMAMCWAREQARGMYLLAGQMLLTVLAALAAADLDVSVHWLFIVVAVSAAVPQMLRAMLQERFAGGGLGQLALVAQWGSIAVLVLLPVAYILVAARPQTGTYLLLLVIAAGLTLFAQAAAVARTIAGGPVREAEATLGAAMMLVALLTVWLRVVEDPRSAVTLGVLAAALAVNILTSVLLHGFFAARAWFEWAAPAGFAAAAVAGAGILGVRGYEVLTAAGLLYCGFQALRRAGAEVRGVYLLAVQVLLTALSALIVADLEVSVHGLFIAVAVSVAMQQMLRTVLQDRIVQIGLGQLAPAARWGSTAALVLLPFAYLLIAGAETRRHVVALSLILLLGVCLMALAKNRTGNDLYPGAYALGVLPLVLSPVFDFALGGTPDAPGVPGSPLSMAAASGILLALGAAALLGEARRDTGLGIRNPLLAAAVAYPVLVLPLAEMDKNSLVAGLGVLLLAGVCFCVSFTRKLPWLAAAAPLGILAASFLVYAWLVHDVLGVRPLPGEAQLWPGFTSALGLYTIRLVSSVLPRDPGTVLRQRILGSGASMVAAGAAAAAMSTSNVSAVYGSVVLICAAAAAAAQFPPARRESAAEAAALVSAVAVQRIVWYFTGDTGWFWALQFWVMALAALACYEFLRDRGQRTTVALSASAALLSGTGLTTVASADAGEQVWALLAHAGLLVFGVLTSRRLLTVWGAAGVAFAVLWYLRGYTFLLLALLAAALITLAVWRLNRVRTDAVAESGP